MNITKLLKELSENGVHNGFGGVTLVFEGTEYKLSIFHNIFLLSEGKDTDHYDGDWYSVPDSLDDEFNLRLTKPNVISFEDDIKYYKKILSHERGK